MLKRAIGTVTGIAKDRGIAVELDVDISGSGSRAVAYPPLTGPIAVGDRVLLNTTAVALSLGTGGYHYVIANLSKELTEEQSEPGHIVKLRYTPMQHAVLSVEEEESPHRIGIDQFRSLNGLPVIVGQLHSQIAPAAAGVKRLSHVPTTIAYVMTDGAALPIGFSRLVDELKNAGLIDVTITAGQAFGGDIEAVNIYTALIAAKEVANADAVIVCQGPGNVGTGTEYGYSAIEQGEIINAVNTLGGTAIAIPRISYADSRPRHQGLSHHTVTSLTKIALTPAVIALPMMDETKLDRIIDQLERRGTTLRHKIRVLDGSAGIDELRSKGINMSSMGRSYEEDPEFFLAAAAAGAAAAQLRKRE